ncbi:MAG TPA: HEAT repeat domain-containing protein, partial [Candidatus Acidoferrales bacterium]|nr:HEAT repeat domain-containing protein [Candidatus Acidoferrales bacterium]
GAASTAPAEGEAALLPWPSGSAEEAAPPAVASAAESASAGTPTGRSEDWTIGDLTVEVEACFVELDALAPVEAERFRREFTDEHLVSPVTAALAIATACLHSQANDADRQELGHFLPRVLRGAIALGTWADAREALRALRTLERPQWSEATFVQELLQPVSMLRLVERLDTQDEDGVAGFIAFAHEVGDPGVDLLIIALCESQQRVVRQTLAEAIAQRCRDNPSRLAPWLDDDRWYVVRNMAHILGWIGGPAIVPLLQVALRSTDARVHAEVVAALATLDLKHARPVLVRALDRADTRAFCQILGQLSAARDPATARFLFAFLQQERFGQRPAEERRAIYAALASVGGEEIVPELENELLKGNWFDRTQEIHRQNVARCLARIATPGARAALERGTRSARAPVRQAAQIALSTIREAA